jgi:hypothetical protein
VVLAGRLSTLHAGNESIVLCSVQPRVDDSGAFLSQAKMIFPAYSGYNEPDYNCPSSWFDRNMENVIKFLHCGTLTCNFDASLQMDI